jgi:hypothetical protein
MRHYAKYFLLYDDGFINQKNLNKAGLKLSELLKKYPELKNIEKIYITSQYRTNPYSISHSSDIAIDFQTIPLKETIPLFLYLSNSIYTVYLSSYNNHTHFDLRKQAKSGIELLFLKDKSKLVLPDNPVSNPVAYNPLISYVEIYPLSKVHLQPKLNTHLQNMYLYPDQIKKNLTDLSIIAIILLVVFIPVFIEQFQSNLAMEYYD